MVDEAVRSGDRARISFAKGQRSGVARQLGALRLLNGIKLDQLTHAQRQAVMGGLPDGSPVFEDHDGQIVLTDGALRELHRYHPKLAAYYDSESKRLDALVKADPHPGRFGGAKGDVDPESESGGNHRGFDQQYSPSAFPFGQLVDLRMAVTAEDRELQSNLISDVRNGTITAEEALLQWREAIVPKLQQRNEDRRKAVEHALDQRELGTLTPQELEKAWKAAGFAGSGEAFYQRRSTLLGGHPKDLTPEEERKLLQKLAKESPQAQKALKLMEDIAKVGEKAWPDILAPGDTAQGYWDASTKVPVWEEQLKKIADSTTSDQELYLLAASIQAAATQVDQKGVINEARSIAYNQMVRYLDSAGNLMARRRLMRIREQVENNEGALIPGSIVEKAKERGGIDADLLEEALTTLDIAPYSTKRRHVLNRLGGRQQLRKAIAQVDRRFLWMDAMKSIYSGSIAGNDDLQKTFVGRAVDFSLTAATYMATAAVPIVGPSVLYASYYDDQLARMRRNYPELSAAQADAVAATTAGVQMALEKVQKGTALFGGSPFVTTFRKKVDETIAKKIL